MTQTGMLVGNYNLNFLIDCSVILFELFLKGPFKYLRNIFPTLFFTPNREIPNLLYTYSL